MNVLVFDTHKFERPVFTKLNEEFQHSLNFSEMRLSEETAYLAKGYSAICVFAHDKVDAKALRILREMGVRLVALRAAGFNNVDLQEAANQGIKVVRVPAYSPYAVAEHAVALILALDRNICRASIRVKDSNFSLEGLMGFDLHGKTIGIIGTGKIGSVLAKIMHGFGCNILAFDKQPNLDLCEQFDVKYVSLEEIYKLSDIISLHLPLSNSTLHLINSESIEKMKKGIMIINTGRGALIDAKALIVGLKTGHVSAAGLDVYEEEEELFFRDLSATVLQDDTLARLMSFPNVLITAHQAFLTREAIQNIVETTLQNIKDFDLHLALKNEVKI